MVFMTVGQHQTHEVIRPLNDKIGIGHYHLDPGQVMLAEGHPQIDHQPFACMAVEIEVHPDLSGATKRQEEKLLLLWGSGIGDTFKLRTHAHLVRTVMASLPFRVGALLKPNARGGLHRGAGRRAVSGPDPRDGWLRKPIRGARSPWQSPALALAFLVDADDEPLMSATYPQKTPDCMAETVSSPTTCGGFPTGMWGARRRHERLREVHARRDHASGIRRQDRSRRRSSLFRSRR